MLVLLLIAAALYQFDEVKESIDEECSLLYKAGLYSETKCHEMSGVSQESVLGPVCTGLYCLTFSSVTYPVGSLEILRVRLHGALINPI